MNEILEEKLETKLRQMEVSKQGSYDKRTEHLDAEGHSIFINRLILEDSPYLLQHAHNPVNWYPWGEEAFEDAKQQNKPIFLSIGYSTCHWCHVMELESFDNVDVAIVLNRDFISIKMDREQYPNIDEYYMTGVQLMSGQGGWPMSNFLLADGKPFFAATYFPAASFIALLHQITEAWAGKYEELESSAEKVSEAINRILGETKTPDLLTEGIRQSSLQDLLRREDRLEGGLAGEPKFPQEPLLLSMLDEARRSRDLPVMSFIDRALEGMARGGIYDQVAGGFHRYSVDAQWLVPHFEKMLYNQSQLGLVYLEAFQLTGNCFFRRVCEQTLDYVLRDMQLPDGGFYSATDADSEGEEGTFFTWSVDELGMVLDKEELGFIVPLFGVTQHGNFEGSNILNLSKPLSESAKEFQSDDFYGYLDDLLQRLYLAREQRNHPLRDDKLIVSWSSAMITTLCTAASVMNRPDWLESAERAAQFSWTNNVDKLSQLRRIYLNGTVSIAGQLEDYANFAQALISLFDVTSKQVYLQQAAQLMDAAVLEFWSEGEQAVVPGFYLSPKQQTGPTLARSRNASDGATLSAVGTALQCLSKLDKRSALIESDKQAQEFSYRKKLHDCIASLSAHINDNPLSHPSALRIIEEQKAGSFAAIQYLEGGLAKIVVRKNMLDAGDTASLAIEITLLKGWHITGPDESDTEFVPIQLSTLSDETSWQIVKCNYPAPVKSGSNKARVSIYEDGFSITAELEYQDEVKDLLSASVGICLRLQLCNEKNCLLPQTLKFRL